MFTPGQIYRRRVLHSLYGGQEQGGISTPSNHPFIMLFTGESGISHGYEDGWTEDGIFLYTGEGQVGDMSFVRGNRALRDHLQDSKDVHLFQHVEKGLVRYVGQMIVTGYSERMGPDTAGRSRRTIVFELVPAEDASARDAVHAGTDVAPLVNLPDNELWRIAEHPGDYGATPEERWQTSRRRSGALHAYVRRRANGYCEGCGNTAPFVTANGVPYLEVHYLRRPSDVGPESPTWVAALCPNCHRRVHLGADAAEYRSRIISRIASH